MPTTMAEIWEQIGAKEEHVTYENMNRFGVLPADVTVKKGKIIFPRIDIDKEIEELNAIIKNGEEEEKREIEPIADNIPFDVFEKVDMRVGTVISCEKVKKSDKLLVFKIDDGISERQIVSGMAKSYEPEELIGKKVTFVANLEPRKLMGLESCGMLLSAESEDGKFKLALADEHVYNGARLC
jgi:methionyl-tRNA synthetase